MNSQQRKYFISYNNTLQGRNSYVYVMFIEKLFPFLHETVVYSKI